MNPDHWNGFKFLNADPMKWKFEKINNSAMNFLLSDTLPNKWVKSDLNNMRFEQYEKSYLNNMKFIVLTDMFILTIWYYFLFQAIILSRKNGILVFVH